LKSRLRSQGIPRRINFQKRDNFFAITESLLQGIKGFGFVVPESGGPDVYVHASALRRSGLSSLLPEQRVRFSTRQGQKGVEVDRIELA